MNCLIWVLLLLRCGNNGSCLSGGCGCDRDRDGRRDRNGSRERDRSNDGCGCGNERQDDNDCGCRTEFRSEPRFEQRPFVFNQGTGCGCEDSQN